MGETENLKARGKLSMLMLAGMLAGCTMTPFPSGQPADGAVSQTAEVAEAAYSVGDYVEAARLYERASEQHPNDVSSYIGLGKSYLAQNQYTRAESALNRARQLQPRNPEVYNILGELALRRTQPAIALEHYSEALRRDSRNLRGFIGKAISLDYLSRHAEAQPVYVEGLKHYPTNFALLNNRALSLVLAGRIGEGTVLLEELLRDPDRGDTARANMAIAYALDGRERDAAAILKGVMTPQEISAALVQYRKLRSEYLAGKPIGYLAFQ